MNLPLFLKERLLDLLKTKLNCILLRQRKNIKHENWAKNYQANKLTGFQGGDKNTCIHIFINTYVKLVNNFILITTNIQVMKLQI